MLNVPDEIKDLFRADNPNGGVTKRKWKLRFFDEEIKMLYPEDTLFPADDLFPVDQEPIYVIENVQMISESLTITESVCSSQNLTFGECCASMFEITVADVLMDLTGKEFMATVEIGGYEMALGIYRVDSFVREQVDRRRKKIVAYDRIMNFDIDVAAWYQGLTFPLTLKQFRDSLCSHVGVTQVMSELPLDGMQITKTIEPEKLDGRKVLMAICELNGCFGNFNKTGRLTYKFLGTSGLFPSETLFPDEQLYPSEMTNAETLSYYKQSETHYEDYVVYPIDKVQIRQEEGDVGASYGPGSNCYGIQGNYLVYGKSGQDLLSIAATLYEQVSGRLYRPCQIVGPALPWVEVGDGIICYTTDDVIETYCLQRTLKGIQGMTDTYIAKGNIEQEQSFGLGDQIIQLEGKTAVIKKSVEEVSVRVTDLKEYTEAQFKVTADQILAEVTRAKEAEASLNIRADGIVASVTNLKNDTNSRFEQTAQQISLKVSKGDVSAQLSVESDKVTISSNRLIVNSTNFQLDGDGNATFSGRVIGGSINIGANLFVANNSFERLGDYQVSADGTGTLMSANGLVNITDTFTSGPLDEFASLTVGNNASKESIKIDGSGDIYSARYWCRGDIYFQNDSWVGNWGVKEMLKQIYNRLDAIRYSIQNMGGNVDWD